MPTNYGSQNVRVATGLINTVNDDYPGGGSQSPGFAPAQLGQRVILGLNEVKYSAAVGVLYEGTYQYIRTYSGDFSGGANIVPARGLEAFWQDRTNYVVTTSDLYGNELAGIFINAIGNAKYGFIQAIQGGRVTIQTSNLGGVRNDIAFVNQAAGTGIATSATIAAITAPQLALKFGKLQAAPVAVNPVMGLVLVALDTQTV
jgi:hypothetical protein